MIRKSLSLVVASMIALSALVPHVAMAAAPDVVHVVANADAYFGGNENISAAENGSFGSVFIKKGSSYDWKLSGPGKRLAWGAYAATGGPAHRMTVRGYVNGGATVTIP